MIDGIRCSVDKRTCTAFVPTPPEPVFCTENERCRGCPYACINLGEAITMKGIEMQSILLDADIGAVLSDLR